MPAPTHPSQPTSSYFHTLLDAVPLPDADRTALLNLSSPQTQSIDYLLRLVTNAPCPPDAPAPISGSWSSWKSAAQAAVRNLLNGSEQNGSDALNPKRKRTASSSDAIAPTKKPKTDGPEQDDPPRVTLHALSVSAPLRKKLDITLHAHTLRLTHPTTHATEAVFPLSALVRSGRAFLLPTRGKAKKGWTVLVLASDMPAPEAKGKPAPDKNTAADDQFQLAFSIDAEPTAPFSVTLHDGAADTVRHAKGTPTAPLLREQFLAHLPCAVFEPAPDAFTSVAGGPGAGIAAYRGAKEETLWFLRDGVLNEGKRSEFWALADLDGEEAVRLLSATGRTCSLFIRRKPPPIDVDAEAGEEEPEGEETEFGMIDGREQEGIKEWVRRRKALFGKDKGKGKGKETGEAVNGQAQNEEGEDTMRDSDEDDSDFEVSSGEYDGGSPSSSSDSDSDNPRSEGVESGSESGDSEDEGEEGQGSASGSDADGAGEESEEEDGPLDPKHHPLMRPGAMPRMSKAAVDMAVGMVMGDVMGGGKAVEYEEDEEDELDD